MCQDNDAAPFVSDHLMGNTPPGTPRHNRFDSAVVPVEHPDEMIFLVRNKMGEIVDAGIDEFVNLEWQDSKYWKLTLTGTDENNPVVLVIRSDSKIVVREFRGAEAEGS